MDGRRGASDFEQDLGRQRELMGERAPAYRRILSELIELVTEPRSTLARGLGRAWQHRDFEAYYERPLLVLAALRYDALLDGESHPLWGALRDDSPDPSAVTREAVRLATAPGRLGLWMTLRTRRVQTNEVRRAVTWLWPAALAGAGSDRPIALADIGASAGLNLVADGLDMTWTDQDGAVLPLARGASIPRRMGFDARPLDVQRPDDVLWLRACLWPGESDRLESLNRAVEAFERASPPPEIERLTASAVPPRLLQVVRALPEQSVLVVYQTLVRGYLQPAERAAYEEAMGELLDGAPPARVLWCSLEVGSESDPVQPASLSVSVRGPAAVRTLELARTSYHPVALDVDRDAVAELMGLFSR